MDRLHQYNPPWKSTGISFINSVTRLLERLLDYRNVLQGDENKDKRMSCTVNLLDFYKTEINRQEMYMRYIYKLHDLHLSAENFTEAGFTLLLHAEKITWTSENVPPMDGLYPAQPQVERKEDIYLKVLKYFDQGKVMLKPLLQKLSIQGLNFNLIYTRCGKKEFPFVKSWRICTSLSSSITPSLVRS